MREAMNIIELVFVLGILCYALSKLADKVADFFFPTRRL